MDQRWRRIEVVKAFAGLRHRRRIPVDAEQASARLDPFQKRAGVPAGTQGAVNDDCPGPGLKQFY
jgi:hypothetical protein